MIDAKLETNHADTPRPPADTIVHRQAPRVQAQWRNLHKKYGVLVTLLSLVLMPIRKKVAWSVEVVDSSGEPAAEHSSQASSGRGTDAGSRATQFETADSL